MTIYYIILFVVLYIILCLILFNYFNSIKTDNNKSNNYHTKVNGTCDAKSCGALDPVSNPAYNMQQIVKQSILLEEHLTNKNKRCRDCITKHFLHIIGLSEEAQMLATKDFKKYPLINENVELYNKLFKKWFDVYESQDEKKILEICDELRNNRKKLIAIYYFNDNFELSSSSK